MNISYHAWKDYEDCPKKYFLKNRKRAPSLVPRNDYFMLYGKLTEKFFTLFCNTWRLQMPYMPPDEIQFKLRKIWDGLLKASVVDWTAHFVRDTEEEIFQQSLSDICSIMDSHNQNFFLNTQSEISVSVGTKHGARITGRLDFVHKYPTSSGIQIFDGKGTNKMGKNVSNDQVLFYALLYYFHYKILPESLGFFYYRFNTFKEVPVSLSILNEFRAKLSLGVKDIMSDTEFKATPCAKACRYCDYRPDCQEGLEDMATRKKPSKLDIPDKEGVVDLGF